MATILVADDSWLARRVVSGILEPHGHELVMATNGREALDLLEDVQPECIFLDLLMPELDGFGVLEALRERGSRIPVIVMTADIQSTSRTRCEQYKVAAFLNKPVQSEALLPLLDSLLSPEPCR